MLIWLGIITWIGISKALVTSLSIICFSAVAYFSMFIVCCLVFSFLYEKSLFKILCI